MITSDLSLPYTAIVDNIAVLSYACLLLLDKRKQEMAMKKNKAEMKAEAREVMIQKFDISEEKLPMNEPWDLYGEDFSRAKLIGICLSGQNFDHSNFAGANLNCANLRLAKLIRCDLESADLGSADLTGADLQDAILDGADLRRTNLTGAKNLTAHQLRGALNLEYAIMDGGRFADAVAAGYVVPIYDRELKPTPRPSPPSTEQDERDRIPTPISPARKKR